METTDENKNAPLNNGSEGSESSADKNWDGEKYPSWQKSIGKEYWGNEKLAQFTSMKDVMESIVNPKKKAPEKYDGISEELNDVAELMKSADIGQEDAKKISDAISKHLPKKYTEESLKDGYGADWEQAERDFSKAVEKILTDEKMKKAFKEIKNNPVVFEFARIVGRNLGDSPNLDISKEQVHKDKGSGDPFLDLLRKKM